MTGIGFGREREETIMDMYRGKLVSIDLPPFTTGYIGVVRDIREGYFILNPFKTERLGEDNLPMVVLEKGEQPRLVPVTGAAITPLNEESYCKRLELHNLELRQKFSKLLEGQKTAT